MREILGDYKLAYFLQFVTLSALLAILVITIVGCVSGGDGVEVHQRSRNQVVDVSQQIVPISTGEVLIGSTARVYVMADCLIIADHKAEGQQIHLFDRIDYHYLASTGRRGQGPGETTILGHIGLDEAHRRLLVADHGQQVVYAFDIDSVLQNPEYSPTVALKMRKAQFPDRWQYVNDTLAYALLITPTSTQTFDQSLARWNMKEGTFVEMGEGHPAVKRRRSSFDVSVEQGRYVECANYHDLMTIGDLQGNLIHHIYGPDWSEDDRGRTHYYGPVAICGDRIVASYSGGDTYSDAYRPRQLLVFDLEGNYLQTLNVGCPIISLCYDSATGRLIMNLDDECQFGYLALP